MHDLAVGDPLDRFRVTELLARGGMASLYKGVDVEDGSLVVLKVPHIQYESDVVFFERFRREEEIGRRLQHPNIVRFVTPAEKSRMYLAMEFVDGTPLNTLLDRLRPYRLPAEEALDIAKQICAALAYLHTLGVVHRDIKPDNIVIGVDGVAKILDFGIATAEAARRLTWAGLSHALGTPDYMAPEQIRGRRGDARTDVYALGTMLYEMLTGHLPHEATPERALLRAKVKEEPTPPSEHVPGFDRALEVVLLTALARRAADRFASAGELLSALEDPATAAAALSTDRKERGVESSPRWLSWFRFG